MRTRFRWLWLAAAFGLIASAGVADAQGDRQRQPPPESDRSRGDRPPRDKAVPREQPQRQPDAKEGQRAEPRAARRAPAGPPSRALPPRYYGMPRPYYFPPIDGHRGYYYHPYFGFYFGPYYGPYYPFPGPYFGQLPFSASAIRLRVTPVETLVYVNGYYAGIVDDFDGVFQRLYVPQGGHEITLYLAGHRTFTQHVFAQPGDTLDIRHRMEPLPPGIEAGALPAPGGVPPEWSGVAAPQGDQPASPYGILALRVEPADAQIFVDGEAWTTLEGRNDLVLHVEAGWHELEVRKEGYQTFRTRIELAPGATTRLNIRLVP